ncbi:MAG: hypothetical protein ABSD61_08740, partial [Terracidiphilus sp.]
VGVGQDQHGHGNWLDEQKLVHLAVRIALDGVRGIRSGLARDISVEPVGCQVRRIIQVAK